MDYYRVKWLSVAICTYTSSLIYLMFSHKANKKNIFLWLQPQIKKQNSVLKKDTFVAMLQNARINTKYRKLPMCKWLFVLLLLLSLVLLHQILYICTVHIVSKLCDVEPRKSLTLL